MQMEKKKMIRKNDVVQFTEHHKWRGCLGIVSNMQDYPDGSARYMIGVPLPSNDGTASMAYIFDDGANIERIGAAVLVESED